MKKILIFFSVISLLAGNTKAAHAKPPTESKNWEYLDYLLRGTVPFRESTAPETIKIKLWKKDIKVAIKGFYTKQDSLELDNAIKAFDKVIPDIQIYWSNNTEANFVVFFTILNKSPLHNKRYIIDANAFKSSLDLPNKLILNHQFILGEAFDATIYIDNQINSNQLKNIIWQSFGKALFNSEKMTGFQIGKLSVLGGELSELTSFDQFFFQTIYSKNFKNDYLNYIKAQYSLKAQFKYLTDADTKSSISWMLQLVLLFGLTYFSYQFFWIKKLEQRISGRFKRFQISGLIFFLPQLLCYPFFVVPMLIQLQHWAKSTPIYLISGVVVFFYFLIIFMLSSLFIYFIEFVVFGSIKKFQHRQLVRISSVLILTSLPVWLNLSLSSPGILTGINLFQIFLTSLLIIIVRFIYFHDQHQKELIRKFQQTQIDRMEQLQTKLKLEALQARTNPHFLYNSFNTIASLVKQDVNKAEEFALKLSKLFRLKFLENEPILTTMSKEIDTIRLYLEIEQERFNDRLHFTIDAPETLMNEKAPSFVLLHLVENAVKHGISKVSGTGEIHIQIKKQNDRTTISVSDNGPDFPENLVHGTGLKNIIEKLNMLYANRYEFSIFKYPQKRVELRLKGNPDEN